MKRCLLMLAAAAVFLLSGCSMASSGGTEVEGLMLIRTVGIDTQSGANAEKPARITVCTGVGLNQTPPKILSREDVSIAAAVENLKYNATGLEPFFSHTQQVLLGEAAAKNGFSAAMDWMLRSMEIRLDTELYAVRGNTAEAVLNGSEGTTTSVSDMLSLLRDTASATGEGYVYNCGEIASSLLSNGNALILAVELEETKVGAEGAGSGEVKPAGYGVICGDTLVGYTEPALSYAVCFLTNHLDAYTMQVTTEDGEYALMLKNASAEYSPVFSAEGKLSRVEVALKTTCTVLQMESGANLVDEAVRETVAAAVQKVLEEDAASVIRSSVDMDVDFLDIGSACRRKAPGKYDAMPADWDEQFPVTEYSISADVQVERTYDLIHPMERQEDSTF